MNVRDIVPVQHIKVLGNRTHNGKPPEPAQPIYTDEGIIGFVYKVNEATADVVFFDQQEINFPNMIVVREQIEDYREISKMLIDAICSNPSMTDLWEKVLQSMNDAEE